MLATVVADLTTAKIETLPWTFVMLRYVLNFCLLSRLLRVDGLIDPDVSCRRELIILSPSLLLSTGTAHDDSMGS
jgi:hypothetical protein